jgi:hypothetical protein
MILGSQEFSSTKKKKNGFEAHSNIDLYEANIKLLIVGGFLILSSTAVITAISLPKHMPTIIENIVNNLIPAYFYMILGGGIIGASVGIGCLAYKGNIYSLSIFKSKNQTYTDPETPYVLNAEDDDSLPSCNVELNTYVIQLNTDF